jgi:hypothetical protein
MWTRIIPHVVKLNLNFILDTPADLLQLQALLAICRTVNELTVQVRHLDPAVLVAIVEALPNLKHLSVIALAVHNSDLLNFRALGVVYPLKSLQIESCNNLSLQGMDQLILSCPGMHSLRLANCTGLTDAVLSRLVGGLVRLTSLQLDSSPLTPAGLMRGLAICGSKLTHLCLGLVPGLGNR